METLAFDPVAGGGRASGALPMFETIAPSGLSVVSVDPTAVGVAKVNVELLTSVTRLVTRIAGDAVPRLDDARQLLDVDVQQVARTQPANDTLCKLLSTVNRQSSMMVIVHSISCDGLGFDNPSFTVLHRVDNNLVKLHI